MSQAAVCMLTLSLLQRYLPILEFLELALLLARRLLPASCASPPAALGFFPSRSGSHAGATCAAKQSHQLLLDELDELLHTSAPPAAKLGVQGEPSSAEALPSARRRATTTQVESPKWRSLSACNDLRISHKC